MTIVSEEVLFGGDTCAVISGDDLPDFIVPVEVVNRLGGTITDGDFPNDLCITGMRTAIGEILSNTYCAPYFPR